MGHLVVLLVSLTLFACQKGSAPVAPETATSIGPDAASHQEMAAWFAERGITLPSEPPAKAVAKPAANDQKILGDATGDGEVDYWDISPLWLVLSGAVWPYGGVDWDLLDIDRDGDRDWDDLQYLGEYIFSSSFSPPNPYRIGESLGLDPATSYNIDLVFVKGHGFSASQMALFEEAAERWEAIITGDVRDMKLSFDSSDDISWWEGSSRETYFGRIVINDTVDDLRVYVNTADLGEYAGRGGPFWLRTSNWLPILGGIVVDENELTASNERDGFIMEIMLHELGHTLGFGAVWERKYLLGNSSRDNPGADTYFNGWRARSSFNIAAHGRAYRGRRTPVENGGDDGHWRESVFGAELMTPTPTYGRTEALSDITIRSFEDLGYEVDRTQADPYRIPAVAAKPVVATGRPFCRVLELPPGAWEEW